MGDFDPEEFHKTCQAAERQAKSWEDSECTDMSKATKQEKDALAKRVPDDPSGVPIDKDVRKGMAMHKGFLDKKEPDVSKTPATMPKPKMRPCEGGDGQEEVIFGAFKPNAKLAPLCHENGTVKKELVPESRYNLEGWLDANMPINMSLVHKRVEWRRNLSKALDAKLQGSTTKRPTIWFDGRHWRADNATISKVQAARGIEDKDMIYYEAMGDPDGIFSDYMREACEKKPIWQISFEAS